MVRVSRRCDLAMETSDGIGKGGSGGGEGGRNRGRS